MSGISKYTKLNIALGIIVLTAFALRLIFITRNIFHADEYISLLAVTRILELGVPYFPSGQLYDHGLLFSYLGAGFAALAGPSTTLTRSAGPSETIVRWVSLFFNCISNSLPYRLLSRSSFGI